jgi:eukaryotic-like serine/threonine-protein kinase
MKICPRCSEVYPDDSDRCSFDGSLLRQEVDMLLGKTIAQRYRLITRVGAGKISIVYLARHVMIDRLSAIKLLRPRHVQDRALCERFLREARAVNRINHDNIVEISDYGEANGFVYLVMEYVPGDTMKKHMSQGLFAWPRAASIGIQIASALGRAHQMGVIHRDISPTSVILVKKKDGNEAVKLIDFGIAKMVDHLPTADTSGMSLPGYAAPEAIASGRSDPQSDLYALGAVLYEAISGVLPSGTIAGGRPPAGASGPLPLDQRVPHVPEPLARVVMQLLAVRPENRQRDAFIVLDELTTVLRDHGRGLSRAPPPPPSSALVEASPTTLRAAQRPDVASRSAPVVVPSSGTSPAGSPGHPPKRDVAAPSSPSDLGYQPPDMNARLLGELEPLCREGLLNVERAIAHHDEVAPEAARMLAEVRRLIDSIALAGDAVRRGQADIAKREAQSSEVKSNFGRALDELGHDLSRANALVTDIDMRIAKLQKQRESELSAQVGQRDAWLWEQGALTEEVQRARSWGHDLVFQVSELRKRLDGQSEDLDSELARSRAALEGHVAALRTLARETWGAIEHAAQMLGIPRSLVGPRT